MISKLAYTTVALLACATAFAQAPPSAPTDNTQPPPTPVVLTLADALARAKANSPQFQAALTELGLAREDRYQARASLLPGVDYNNAFTYTQGNGSATGRYIGSNGVHEYLSQGVAHETIGAAQVLDYQRTAAAPPSPPHVTRTRASHRCPSADSVLTTAGRIHCVGNRPRHRTRGIRRPMAGRRPKSQG